jgi:hypothetical protein
MNLFFRSLICLGLCSLPSLAHATGGVWCDHDDANMKFDFKAVMSRDGTGGWFDIAGSLTTKFGKLPKHLASFDIKDKNLTQRWIGREGILLEIQKYDTDPNPAVMLTVVTKSIDEGPYEGTYELRITADSGDEAFIIKEGKIECGAD